MNRRSKMPFQTNSRLPLALLVTFVFPLALGAQTQDREQRELDRGIDPKGAVEVDFGKIFDDANQFQELLKDGQKRSRGEYVTDKAIDLDGDGKDDLALQSTFSRAGLGIHYVVHRAKCLGGTRILKDGKPLKDGKEILVRDLLSTKTEVHMCSVGGSLNAKHKELPAETFCHGPWWNKKNHSLAFVIEKEGKLKAGYIKLSFSLKGWEIGETTVSKEIGGNRIIEIDDMRP